MKYVLLIDNDEDILNLQSIALSSFYGGDVVLVKNSKDAILKIEAIGVPELIVADHMVITQKDQQLYDYLYLKDLCIPLIICSSGVSYQGKEKKYPLVTSFVDKPYGIDSLSAMVKSITTEPVSHPHFIPIKLPVLLNFIGKSFDLYLKLSESNFVKVIKSGEDFTPLDTEKFINKGVTHLHVSINDSYEFLKAYEENLNLLIDSKLGKSEDTIVHAIFALTSIENVSKRLNWTPEVIELTKKSVESALRIICKDANLLSVLKKKCENPNSSYNRHVGMLTYLCCTFSQNLPWGGELVSTKLALASLLHDLAVDESYYDDIKNWNKKAVGTNDRTPMTVKYRLHPLEASKLIQSMKATPPDVEQILLQHHEKKDGSGFPRGITSSRISPLATFFTIVEELVEFIGDGENLETSLKDFITWGDASYESGYYKKAYDFIRKKII